MNWLQRLVNVWAGLQPREQRLARAVAALVCVMSFFFVFRAGTLQMRQLQGSLDRLQDQLGVSQRLVFERDAVESEYARVASQHSTAWTEAEILDRLRQEIYRLAEAKPAQVDRYGRPLLQRTGESEARNLVEIPALGQGRLAEDEGFWEYSISFNVPPCPVENMMTFLQRLQNSPQSLRIDGLELVRDLQGTEVSATIDLVRVIVARPLEGEEATAAPESGEVLSSDPEEWHCEGCTVNTGPQAQESGLEVQGGEGGGSIHTLQKLSPGVTYELVLDAVAEGPAALAIAQAGGGATFEGEAALKSDGGLYRYHVVFTTPAAHDAVELRLPLLTWSTPHMRLYLGTVRLLQQDASR